jgi:hypothetical protein
VVRKIAHCPRKGSAVASQADARKHAIELHL